ncbi:DNA helicase-2/ATP-dependent DNA helicase PcrA [Parabacteroides sp. PF5-5]|uniref:HelD family protein n=1 Tax=unclassified Parabacteroides TaxID=2649774 RepID=UPI0024754DA3|nr:MULTISPECIES: UvrD-helicase domain-containing protein [unclassified Parabacteroides]MDH6305294.1 DNA helicase-2/ATP-dependent DNA helicase PcrA [Parabacteroides sp. PH5-39]MDH6316647.1 DNA helicase-2/ATP-dependent DNA helicase PcrA [Parabacteroides sp. PF5-13]MDH6320173.1 DNA helicase-2/ATP-dependent DNA helicase PcrA [Parabacteroides sp. PH5-13]MDH6323884.1 DNA helicase-2/ATP-dependent DNA helicase PcrA [Parabacteroides sp. PH5-8]MDH6327850.1 DNA helicase-2/ATP-dependent DNA helicase PcrA 
MIFNKTEEQEHEYLQQVINLLNKTISSADVSVKERVKTLNEQKQYLWDNRDIDPHEITQVRGNILNVFALGEEVIAKRKRLGKILDIPYFGRIDFKERKKEKGVPIYIGVHSFYEPESLKNIIYDWRAPISSMFYEYELGEASYLSPTGKIEGDILLKRQYRIRKGHMEFMIESSVTVHDDILQKELSFNADDKMKNIVATIQREQNRIIRNEDAPALIIQGVAGSGKTSIALHRIAYLLYTFKETLSSKDILIISPNKVFADYISNVLPELGEETVPETSIDQILSGILGNKYKYQTFFEQINELLGKPATGFIERIQYKASFDFISQLDRFILHIENTYFKATDVKLTKFVTLPGEYIEEQFHRFNRYPMRQRFETMTDYILEMAQIQYHITVTTVQRNMLKKEIRNMFAGNNDMQVYKDFFEWIGKPELFKMRKNHTLEYADLAPLAYLHTALDGNNMQSSVKHLLVDEMQDYSPIQYKVLQKLYPCRKTILGDANQSVNPYGSSTSDMIQKVFASGKVMKLCKSYRSTYEITEFAQRIRENEELEPVARHGQKPQILECKNEEEEIAAIVKLIVTFKQSDYKSLGIICKTESQAQELSDKLNTYTDDIYFLSSQSSAFVQGIIIISAHMAKGLEFDEVIIPQANENNYHSEIDRSMLYVAVTRAMHKLSLTYVDLLINSLKKSSR